MSKAGERNDPRFGKCGKCGVRKWLLRKDPPTCTSCHHEERKARRGAGEASARAVDPRAAAPESSDRPGARPGSGVAREPGGSAPAAPLGPTPSARRAALKREAEAVDVIAGSLLELDEEACRRVLAHALEFVGLGSGKARRGAPLLLPGPPPLDA